MSLLRSYRDDTPEPGEERLRPGRARLEARLADAATASAPARRLVRRVVLLGVLAAATAAGLVALSVTAGPAPQASAEASRLLAAAAGTAQHGADDGARTVVVLEEGLSEQADGGRITAAYSTRTMRSIRVPAGDGEWVRSSWPLAPDAFYGGAAAHALADREAADASTATAAHPDVDRSADGTFTNGELGGGTSFGDDPAQLRALPEDPAALLTALRRADLGVAGPRGQAAHVLEAASILLSSGVASGDQQAAAFRALRLQPGLAVTDHDVEVDGRAAAAIGEAAPAGRYDVHQLLLDPRDGAYLGDRTVSTATSGVVPAGTVVASTTVVRG